MDQSLLVFVLSVLVFVLGAVFINYTVKKDEAKKAQKEQVATVATAEPAKKAA